MANSVEKQSVEKVQLHGIIGFFDGPEALLNATQKVREAEYSDFDAYTPYPVHGMDAAQGLKRSPIPFVTLAAGITGCSCAFLLEYWTSAVDWPLIVGGKPFNSWPAFVPIMFELTVLFAGLSTVAAMFILNRLPNIFRKAFDPRITQDRFALVIEKPRENAPTVKNGKKAKIFDAAEAEGFLKKLGAKDVKSVYSEGWF